jgi:hypothetical protein
MAASAKTEEPNTEGKTPKAETGSDKSYVVAPGRTVTTDDGDKGPGETVTLPVKEGDRLQRLGFFIADDGSRTVADSEGPAVVQGSEIKEP